MKRTFYFCLFVLLTITMSCNKNSSEMMKLTAERDSLLNSNKLISDEKNELDAFITEVAECLDSITQQEQILVTNTDNNGHRLNKQQIIQNLKTYEEILNRKRAQIQTLADSLSVSGKAIELQGIINHLSSELAEKNAKIKSLKKELSKRNVRVNELESDVDSLDTKNKELQEKNGNLTEEIAAMSEALVNQDKYINECFFISGTKKELKALGILKKENVFVKKTVDYENIDESCMEKVDIRTFTEILLNSSKPKFVSPTPPASSFVIEDNGNNTSTLRITDPSKFWNASKFLIIQL